MIAPNEVHAAAARLEKENYRFRSFLKGHADSEELDEHIHWLHSELFSHYDCAKCRNCCRAYRTSLSEDEIDDIAAYLELPRQEFIKTCLIEGVDGFELLFLSVKYSHLFKKVPVCNSFRYSFLTFIHA